MSRLFRFMILLSCVPLISCATQGAYQEPKVSDNVAYLNLKQDSTLEGMAKAAVQMPTYSMNVARVDGKPLSNPWKKSQIALSPGPHTLLIGCSINGRGVGEKPFTLNAKAGQTYTVSFPASLNGYTYLSTACDRMELS